jgi:GxxExxY protein
MTGNTGLLKKSAGPGVIYAGLSYQILEAAFEVHNQLGPGYSEEIYERALAIEFDNRQIPYELQKIIIVTYKGHELANYRLDILVDDKIILELKAVSSISPLFKQQLLSYLKATGIKLGILINFGTSRVESTRIVN